MSAPRTMLWASGRASGPHFATRTPVLALAAAARAAEPPPRLMLWAWERPTDLRFLKPADAGVAYHFATLTLDTDGSVKTVTRHQPLRLPAGMFKLPVVRIDARAKAPLNVAQRKDVVEIVAEALRLARTRAIQLDFDAPASAHPFYRALLDHVRRRVGPGVFLSITALASWCGARSWMAGLAVDEIVPMLFRMGARPPAFADPFEFAGCRTSLGIEAGGARRKLDGLVRIYVFPDARGWSAKTFTAIQNEVR